MLILTRKLYESITIGEGDRLVTVTVTRIAPDNVRLGIEAPRDMVILRAEVERLTNEPQKD